MSLHNEVPTPTTPTTSTNETYVSAAKTYSIPTAEQAVIVKRTVNASFEEYLTAFAKIVSPTKITYADKISNERMIVWFDNKRTVDELIDNRRYILW